MQGKPKPKGKWLDRLNRPPGNAEEKAKNMELMMAMLSSHYKLEPEYFGNKEMTDTMIGALIEIMEKERGMDGGQEE